MRISALVFAAATLLAANISQAYFSVIDTGEVIKPGSYQGSFEGQLITQNYDGFNAVGRFDAGLTDETSARALLGFGKVDYQVGGFYKYVPFPDTGNQPAIGGEVGVILGKVNGDSQFSIRFNPLVSKKLETEIGDITPYGSLPIGITTMENESVVPIQLVGGAELTPINLPNLSFFGEVGMNVSKAFGHISAAVAWRFDELETR